MKFNLMQKRDELESRKEVIIAVWEKNQRNTKKTAEELGIAPSTLFGKLQQWEVIHPRSRPRRLRDGKPSSPPKSKLFHQSQAGYASMIEILESIYSQTEVTLQEAQQEVSVLAKQSLSILTVIEILKKKEAQRLETLKQAASVRPESKESSEKAS